MIPVVYEDQNLLVFDKPANLVVDNSITQKEETLEDILKSEYKITLERGGIVHRLDKDTSGLLVVAKTLLALESLQAQFKNRQVHKEYLALVHGTVSEKGVVAGLLGRNPREHSRFVVLKAGLPREGGSPREAGKQAVTEYEPLERLQLTGNSLPAGKAGVQSMFPDIKKSDLKRLSTAPYTLFTLLRCFPLTGRTHQIRVHLKYAGFPIVGDLRYGGRKTSQLDKLWVPRHFLHAAKLEFSNPESGEKMRFESSLPADLERVLSRLEVVAKTSYQS